MIIRQFEQTDLPRIISLWNQAAAAGEVLYKQLNTEYFNTSLFTNPNYDPAYSLVADCDGRVIGFISAACRKRLMCGEAPDNAPVYLTALFVDKSYRNQGVGGMLVNSLETRLKATGKHTIVCDEHNPIKLSWLIPGTNGHDHDRAPGIDESCPGYMFLVHKGYAVTAHEVAMYLNLASYRPLDALDSMRAQLEAEDISTGRYDCALNYEYDGMFDRVGNEYWRTAFIQELAQPGPHPMLVATHEHSIIGFAGPVYRQPGGRGGFAGLCTDPRYECRGIATVLFNLLMQEFIQAGATFSSLCAAANGHARRICERAGFQEVRRFAAMRKELE